MEEKDLEFFRQLLIQWMEELLNHADETVEELLDPQENLADPLYRTAAESDRIPSLFGERSLLNRHRRLSGYPYILYIQAVIILRLIIFCHMI